MSGHRFYTPGLALSAGKEVHFPERVSRQITRVLRMNTGDQVSVFDGSGTQWPAKISGAVDTSAVRAVVGSPETPQVELPFEVTVCQALIPSERMEFVVQKCTELGVTRILPINTQRVQARDRNPGSSKLERWQRITVEASEQSGRVRVPEVMEPVSLAESVDLLTAQGPAVMLWESERAISLRTAAFQSLSGSPGHVGVLIGPVGGLSAAEAEKARESGVILAGAGPRILRAETAPVVALTALLLESGQLG